MSPTGSASGPNSVFRGTNLWRRGGVGVDDFSCDQRLGLL